MKAVVEHTEYQGAASYLPSTRQQAIFGGVLNYVIANRPAYPEDWALTGLSHTIYDHNPHLFPGGRAAGIQEIYEVIEKMENPSSQGRCLRTVPHTDGLFRWEAM